MLHLARHQVSSADPENANVSSTLKFRGVARIFKFPAVVDPQGEKNMKLESHGFDVRCPVCWLSCVLLGAAAWYYIAAAIEGRHVAGALEAPKPEPAN